jgi:hypothetical protein
MAGLIHRQQKPGNENFQLQNGSKKTRSKRNADSDESLEFPANKALVIECSRSEWQCASLICRTDLQHSQIAANLELRIQIDTSYLGKMLNQKRLTYFFINTQSKLDWSNQ